MAPRILLNGLRHMRDEHTAEDLTQQVLITTIEALQAGACVNRRSLCPSYWERAG
jgi:hypothetical protein